MVLTVEILSVIVGLIGLGLSIKLRVMTTKHRRLKRESIKSVKEISLPKIVYTGCIYMADHDKYNAQKMKTRVHRTELVSESIHVNEHYPKKEVYCC